jgi:hypothetical protein
MLFDAWDAKKFRGDRFVPAEAGFRRGLTVGLDFSPYSRYKYFFSGGLHGE